MLCEFERSLARSCPPKMRTHVNRTDMPMTRESEEAFFKFTSSQRHTRPRQLEKYTGYRQAQLCANCEHPPLTSAASTELLVGN